jgi:hypothetical protein
MSGLMFHEHGRSSGCQAAAMTYISSAELHRTYIVDLRAYYAANAILRHFTLDAMALYMHSNTSLMPPVLNALTGKILVSCGHSNAEAEIEIAPPDRDRRSDPDYSS